MRLLTVVLSLVALAGSQGCKQAEARSRRIGIPYHLAIAFPREEPVAPADGEEGPLLLRVDIENLVGALEQSLGREFTRVSVIPPLPEPSLKAHRDAAKAMGADLLLESRLDYDPRVEHGRKGQFVAANLLLFLIGGPFSWWLGDNVYETDADLKLEFLDLHLLDRALVDGSPDPRAEALTHDFTADVEPITLSYEDRVENWGDWGSRALSIVVPASFLARSNEVAVEKVRAETRTAMVDDVLAKLDERRLRRRNRTAFLSQSRLSLVTSGEAELEMVLDLSRSGRISGYDPLDLEVGVVVPPRPEGAESPPEPWTPQDPWMRLDLEFEEVSTLAEGEAALGLPTTQTFRVRVPSDLVLEGGAIQVRLEADAAEELVQSWTFTLQQGPLIDRDAQEEGASAQ